MSDSDIWIPAPCIIMKFSQHPPQSRDVLLTYSTDTEKVDPEKAREQASILTEWHFESIPKDLRAGKNQDSTIHCARIKNNSILIKDLGIIATEEQGNENERQHMTSVSDLDMVYDKLHIPQDILGGLIEFNAGKKRYPIRTQISFVDWKETVEDRVYVEGHARVSDNSVIGPGSMFSGPLGSDTWLGILRVRRSKHRGKGKAGAKKPES